MHMRLLGTIALGVLLAACGGGSHPEPACCPAPTQWVLGHLVGVGGPSGAVREHWRGRIHFSGPVDRTVRTNAGGRYYVTLPRGTYRITGTSPSYDGGHGICHGDRLVHLKTGDQVHVRVLCQLK